MRKNDKKQRRSLLFSTAVVVTGCLLTAFYVNQEMPKSEYEVDLSQLSAEQKQETRRKMLEKQREEMEKLQALEVNGRIHFGELPVLEPRIREILLKWLSDAMESADFSARTDDGRRYILDRSRADETCVVHCLDGNFTMPDLSIVFQEET